MSKICPKCRSREIDLYMGGNFGQYQCNNCGYVGALVLEENKEKPKRFKL